jgi:hypothetical protein
MLGNYREAAQVVASRTVLSSTELVSSHESKVAVTEEAWGEFGSPEKERTTTAGSQYQRTGKDAAG